MLTQSDASCVKVLPEAPAPLDRSQSLFQVGEQGVGVLEANRLPEQTQAGIRCCLFDQRQSLGTGQGYRALAGGRVAPQAT